jgi:hypothetical protein
LSPCGAANQAAAKVKFFPILLALLQCKNEPPAPAPATATDGEVARPEINLMAAGCDCLDKVASIARPPGREARPASTVPNHRPADSVCKAVRTQVAQHHGIRSHPREEGRG